MNGKEENTGKSQPEIPSPPASAPQPTPKEEAMKRMKEKKEEPTAPLPPDQPQQPEEPEPTPEEIAQQRAMAVIDLQNTGVFRLSLLEQMGQRDIILANGIEALSTELREIKTNLKELLARLD